ncbi:MAG: glycosyltransferase [Chloroflexota bacterium]
MPQAILDAAHARSTARSERRWEDADRLRGEIEAAGWRVIDSGVNFRLELAGLPDVVADGTVKYGSSSAVPSRAGEPVTLRSTIVLIATDAPGDAETTLEAVFATRQEDDQIVVVLDGPEPRLDGLADRLGDRCEVVATATRLGAGASLNVALRRATGRIVVVLGPGVEPTGDFISPLAAALEDPTVAVAGRTGQRTADLRRGADITADGDATTISGEVLAFRREDGLAAMPVDEAFMSRRHLHAWLSLTLRAGAGAEGADAQEAGPVRRAVVVGDLPIRVQPNAVSATALDPEAARRERRNFYRVLRDFRDRDDLLDQTSGA